MTFSSGNPLSRAPPTPRPSRLEHALLPRPSLRAEQTPTRQETRRLRAHVRPLRGVDRQTFARLRVSRASRLAPSQRMAAPPGRASSRQPTTSTPLPTILQRFVKANQDLARHNAKVRARTLASSGETQLCLTTPSLAAPARPPRGASQGGSRRERRGAGAHRHRAIPQAERGGVAREARAPGAPAAPTDTPPPRFPPSHHLLALTTPSLARRRVCAPPTTRSSSSRSKSTRRRAYAASNAP